MERIKKTNNRMVALLLTMVTVLLIMPTLTLVTEAATDYSEIVNSYFKKVTVVSLSETDARIYGDLAKTTSVKESGFYIGTSQSSLTKNAKHDGAFSNCQNIAYSMSKYYGKLKPGTKYYYKLYYITKGGTERTSAVNWFITRKSNSERFSSNTNAYFKSVTVVSLSDKDARISGDLAKATSVNESGFYIGSSEASLKKNAKHDGRFSNCENIAYSMSKYYGTLTPGTKYYYKLYYITTGGTEYTSPVNWFITSGSGSNNVLTVYYNVNGASTNKSDYFISDNLLYETSSGKKFEQTWTSQEIKQYGLYNVSSFGLAKTGYTFLGWSLDQSDSIIWNEDDNSIMAEDINPMVAYESCTATLYARWKKTTDIYNLGEETYSFKNYSDKHSGTSIYHCFGMSMTSAAYYLGLLDKTYLGISDNQTVYSVKEASSKVRVPICHYQDRQGKNANTATVAGGRSYKGKPKDVAKDWEEVVGYVRNHKYDGTGALQLAFRSGTAGHAINFLRYEVVNGEDRLYAYDSNCPTKEVYLYKDSKGNIKEAVYQTLSGTIDCVALRDVKKYFELQGSFDGAGAFYADEGAIAIEGATENYMDCGDTAIAQVMYEIPEGTKTITIIPMVENAQFCYLEKTYSFGSLNDDMVGIFTLATMDDDDGGVIEEPDFVLVPRETAPRIKNNPGTRKVDYKGSIILCAQDALPAGMHYEWYVDGIKTSEDMTLTLKKLTADCKVELKAVDTNGNQVGVADTETIDVKTTIFARLIAFLRGVLGIRQQVIEQEYFGTE